MKKGLKITLIVIGSLIGVIGITALSLYLYFKFKIDGEIEEAEKNDAVSEEVVKINELAGIVYDSLPSSVDDSFTLTYEFTGYDDFKIEYKSSNEAVISNKGFVTRGNTDVIVVFTYTITYKEETKDFTKNITVLKTIGQDLMVTIVNEIRSLVPVDIKNNSKLPISLEGYDDLEITWDLKVINSNTNEVEPTIKIVKENNEYSIVFTKADKEDICFINATIKLGKKIKTQKFVVYTKTIIE